MQPVPSSAQLSPTHGIDQLNKILVAFGIKLIKAWVIRGSLLVRGETEVHETKCQCIALRRGVAVQPPAYVVSIVVADACCQDAGGCVRGDGSGGPGRLWWKKATAKAYVESECARIGFRLKNSPIPIKLLLVECGLGAVRSLLNKIC